jgi:hypothetical protein
MSTHYVVEINIKSVTKPPSATNGRPRPAGEPEREIDDVIRIVLKSETLPEAIERAREHLNIAVPDEYSIEPEPGESREQLVQKFKKAVRKEDEWRDE